MGSCIHMLNYCHCLKTIKLLYSIKNKKIRVQTMSEYLLTHTNTNANETCMKEKWALKLSLSSEKDFSYC